MERCCGYVGSIHPLCTKISSVAEWVLERPNLIAMQNLVKPSTLPKLDLERRYRRHTYATTEQPESTIQYLDIKRPFLRAESSSQIAYLSWREVDMTYECSGTDSWYSFLAQLALGKFLGLQVSIPCWRNLGQSSGGYVAR
jgi:hypothetical protein